ncbi:MAG TPA: prepilin peptidase [Dongiaceae bacterium]|jgi:leader peptidase (prepilin peptidase)/N-methyltransferase|nr:prepilin peptidase [Dongiaceae bacterium]
MGIDAIFNAHNWELVPFHFWSLTFFALGCIVGSFLNVCIYRMPLDLSVVTPPSHCPHCKYSIPFYLNVPLVTWLWLGGKCKNCGAPISPRYFIVEFLTGTAFLSCWLAFGAKSPALAIVYSIFIAGLIVATFIDFEHFIIPDEITLGGIVAGFAASFFLPSLHDADSLKVGMLRSALGILVGAGVIYAFVRLGKLMFGRQKIKFPPATKVVFSETCLHLPDKEIPYDEIFYRRSDTIVLQAKTVELIDRGYENVAVRLSSGALKIGGEEIDPDGVQYLEAVTAKIILPREAMGLGDVKFLGAIGAFLGCEAVFFTLAVSSMIGTVYAMIMIARKKQEWSGRIYFGPFLSAAAVIWIFGGKKIFTVLFH